MVDAAQAQADDEHDRAADTGCDIRHGFSRIQRHQPATGAAGAASAAGLQARFAATDLAVDKHRARDLSTVVWATTVGAVVGPNLADPAGRVALELDLPELTGGFLLAALRTWVGGAKGAR